eukprot:CAMPEP_0113635670 /NCGR_PEP_ID=MMETSP0017_2-20120614/18596_1 /TAXON_ID=2856 /ORGANISM="Cylindrotheca closterium" /LENGTH=424 /DNA_ID=CAMNT_0000546465 /DNA_START=68 /DNA_END=1339 /DNA_ORIENTATION=- /assembly_acc=CAM_ASM_000147
MVESNDIGSDDKIDSLIANALNQLSLDERETVYYEMHGVDEIVQETPDLVETSLNRLEFELERIKHTHRKAIAYRMAEEMSPDYVHDQTLRMKFLRSEKFDIQKTSERFIRYFDCKLLFFGKEKLCKDITLQDLDKDDLKSLKAGYMQILPIRDRAGRPVFIALPQRQTFKTPMNKYRSLFYLCETMLDDVETQRRGITFVVYNVGNFVKEKYDSNAMEHTITIQKSLPFKPCSLHYCFNDSGFRFVINIAMHFFGEDFRSRVKLHFGTHLECSYSLMTFGCPVHSLPVSIDGDLKRKAHLEFIRMRYQQEMRLGLPRIVVPTLNDVLFGRGKPYRQHVANIKLHAMMEAELKHEQASSLKGKRLLTIEKLMDGIRNGGGRFLQQDDVGCWVEVDEKAVQEKVGRAFRTHVRSASSGLKQLQKV